MRYLRTLTLRKLTFFRRLFDPLETETGTLKNMRKSAKIVSRVTIAFIILTILLFIVTEIVFGDALSRKLLSAAMLVFTIILALNYYRFSNVSSILLCALLPIMVMCSTLLLKTEPVHSDLLYYDSRMMLLAFSALPGMVFSTREPWKLYGTISVSFLCFLLYDSIHESLGLGYYQEGFTQPNYYHINTISLIVLIAITGGSVILKRIVVEEESKNASLLEERETKNQELAVQNEEITAQTEELLVSQEQLSMAYEQIERQKKELEELVKIKSKNLSQSNEALQKYNSELRQFSYTVSHNLRAPVARLLGLSNLLDLGNEALSEDQRKILVFLKSSSYELDGIIKDLNRIVDIRDDLYAVREKVDFEQEWARVYQSLLAGIVPGMIIETNFAEAPTITAIRPYIHSILYNLASNAIKYQSPDRELKLSITTRMKGNVIQLLVADNGLGFDLKQYLHDVFGMYKRFHTHTEGKGLGLYLVKVQVESMGGTVYVVSEVDKGSTFIVELPME